MDSLETEGGRMDQFARPAAADVGWVSEILRLRHAQMHCIQAAEQSTDNVLRSFWLAAAEAYAILRASFEELNVSPAGARTGRLSRDSTDTPLLRDRPDR